MHPDKHSFWVRLLDLKGIQPPSQLLLRAALIFASMLSIRVSEVVLAIFIPACQVVLVTRLDLTRWHSTRFEL